MTNSWKGWKNCITLLLVGQYSVLSTIIHYHTLPTVSSWKGQLIVKLNTNSDRNINDKKILKMVNESFIETKQNE